MKKILGLLILLWAIPVATQALTISELRVRSELLLSQDTAAVTKKWSNTELRYWINSGIRLISGLAECIEKQTSVALVAREEEYAMPSDFIRVSSRGVYIFKVGTSQSLDRSTPVGLIPKDGAAFGKEATVGSGGPTMFIDMGRSIKKISLSPYPTVAGDSLKVTYVAYGATYTTDTSSTPCELPEELQEIIPMYVRYRAQKKYVVEGNYWNEFIQELQLIVPTLGPVRQMELPAASPGPGVTP